jgi:hypothetical protein
MTARRPRAARGSSLAEALVAAALAGLALALVAQAAWLARRGLALARDTSAALALAEGRLEALRAGPRADGDDAIPAAGVPFARAWRVREGRGRATRADVEVTWPGHGVRLETGMLP